MMKLDIATILSGQTLTDGLKLSNQLIEGRYIKNLDDRNLGLTFHIVLFSQRKSIHLKYLKYFRYSLNIASILYTFILLVQILFLHRYLQIHTDILPSVFSFIQVCFQSEIKMEGKLRTNGRKTDIFKKYFELNKFMSVQRIF